MAGTKTTTGRTRRPRAPQGGSGRRYAVGEASRDRILAAAGRVLERDGYHAFSTRRVAEECGISSGNLTYYFPTKDSLIEALMDAIYEQFAQRYADSEGASTEPPSDRLTALVERILWDAVDARLTGLFFELWVMARHNDFAADLVGRLYERGVRAIADAMTSIYPDRASEDVQRAAYLLATLLDGVGSVFSQRGDRSVGPEEIIPLAVEAVRAVLESPTADA